MPPVYWLSLHVPYACRDSGACCSSGWPIPIERARVAAVQMLRRDGSWLLPAPDAPPEIGGTLAVSDRGHCVFHRDRREGCEIQRALGPGAVPTACQHFPREVLIDRRGVFVTLSHYCPTAADLLFAHRGPVEIVEGPMALAHGEPEGLDARDVLPPLLTDDLLIDYDGYTAWEAHVTAALTRDDGRTPEEALRGLWRDLAVVRAWRPGGRSLAAEIARLAKKMPPGHETSVPIPGETSVPSDVVIRRYLAARAFGSWMAYLGCGVAAVLGSLSIALSALRDTIARLDARDGGPLTDARLKEAIRATDLRLVHEMPRAQLAAHADEVCARQMSKSATTGP